MHIQINARGFTLSKALKEYSESKVRLALGLYRDKVRRVDVFLTDVNGPKGGEDMMCKITAKPERQAAITAQATTTDMYAAINTCSHRIRRAASRRFDRALQRRKTRLRGAFPNSELPAATASEQRSF